MSSKRQEKGERPAMRKFLLFAEFILCSVVLIVAFAVCYPWWFLDPPPRILVWAVSWNESVEERMRATQ